MVYVTQSIVSLPFIYVVDCVTYPFMAALGLHCCVWAFSSCGKWGYSRVAMHGLLIVVASLVSEHRL